MLINVNLVFELAAIIFFTVTLAPHSVTAAKLGDACAANPSTLCDDANTFLVCDEPNDRCICQNGAISYFDQLDGKCHIFHSGLCLDDTPTNQPCPVNGYCQVFEYPFDCRCVGGFTQTPTNKCAKNYQEACTDHPKCDRDAFMQCLHQICQCDHLTSRYESNVCRIKATQSCGDTYQQCTQWSTCKEATPGGGDLKCLCDDGLLDNGQGVCQAKIGETCATDGSRDCLDSGFMTCDSGSGECMCDPLTSHPDSKNTICYLDNGASCRTGVDDQPCDLENFFKCDGTTCGCATTVAANGVCVLDHDSPCQPGPDQQPCDGSKFLTCGSGGKCDCGANAEWDGTKSMCILKNGATCVGNLPTDQPCHVENFVDCRGGVCKCDETIGADFDSTGTKCVLQHAASCVPGPNIPPCDPDKFLSCEGQGTPGDEKCACGLTSSYDSGIQKCVINVGGDCTHDPAKEQCNPSQFLFCGADDTCGCADDADIDPVSGLCVLGFGATCVSGLGQQPCNNDKLLECLIGGTCGCAVTKHRVFDEYTGKCAWSVGATCTPPALEDCVTNSVCTNGQCECMVDDGFEENVDGKCLRPYGAGCALDHEDYCDHDALQVCDRLKCACRNPNEMIYDEPTQRCYVSLHHSCSASEPCAPRELVCSSDGECVCNKEGGYVNEQDGKCLKTFDSFCDPNDGNGGSCDFTGHVECIDGKCRCTFNYEQIGEKCLGNFNASCATVGFELYKNSSTFIDHLPATFQPINEEDCNPFKFLVCGPDNICACSVDADYEQNWDLCVLNFDAACSTEAGAQPCDPSMFLSCTGGRCGCGADAHWIQPQAMCVLNAGAICDNNAGGAQMCDFSQFFYCEANGRCGCGPNAHLDPTGWTCVLPLGAACDVGPGHQSCDLSQFLVCNEEERKCVCQIGTIFDPISMTCVAPQAGDPCLDDKDCSSDTTFLECDALASTCRCKEPGTSYFELADGKCHKFVAQSCDEELEGGEMDCPLNGGCDLFENPAICKCVEAHNFHPTATKKCARPHLAHCLDSTECDRDAFLMCGDQGTCVCDENSWFDPATEQCILLAGVPCNPANDMGAVQPCAPNSFCSTHDHLCHCEEGLYENEKGLCFLKIGEPCNPTSDLCDLTEFHHCSPLSAECECADGDNIVEEFAGMCRLRANARCSLDYAAQECTTNSNCTLVENSYLCICNAGLMNNFAGKCVLPYASFCGGDIHGTCNFDGFQSCNDGVCGCADESHMEFEPSREKCFLKINSPCVPGGVIECKEHAICDLKFEVCACDGAHGWISDGLGNCVQQRGKEGIIGMAPSLKNFGPFFLVAPRPTANHSQ